MALARVEIPVIATDAEGNVVPGAEVSIVDRETGVAPTVYQTPTGGATRSLPLTTGANGKPPTSWVVRAQYTVTIEADEIGTDVLGWDAATAAAASIEKDWLSAAVQQSLAAAGDLKPTAAALSVGTQPDGWLFCDGRAVSRTTYADLFAKIGTAYGVGDGTTSFNLPDGRDAAIIGGSGPRPRGTKGGEASHVLTTAEIPAHTHGPAAGSQFITQGGPVTNFGVVLTSGGTIQGPAATASAGGGDSHNNMPPFQAVGGWLIKT